VAQPVILALETSQRAGSVCVRDRAGEFHLEPLRAEKRHDDDLMAAVDRTVERLGLTPRDLDAIAVSVGPGGFSGLRIAVAAAKMLAESLALPIVAVPGALVAAEAVTGEGPIVVGLAVKGETLWATRLRRAAGAWCIEGDPGLTTAATIELEACRRIVGDDHLPAALLERAAALGVPVLPLVVDAQRCAQVAARMLRAGQTTDPLVLAPLYPREPEAVTLWKKRRASR
jgi:tRNA threonylcarbamoyladenosine biosynthesis protein TsaB